MFGFVITNSTAYKGDGLTSARSFSYGDTTFFYSPLPKFENDKLFFEDEEKIAILDGVIYNKQELMCGYGCDSWQVCFDRIFAESPELFMNKLRGSFCGAILSKNKGTLMVFENQSGEKPIYYSVQKNFFVVASHNNLLLPLLKAENISTEADVQGCRELTALGYCAHGNTPFAGVRRLFAGKKLYIEKGTAREDRYHMFRNIPEHNLSMEECVEEFDKRFRVAVDRIFSKNEEYGYQAECDLSGGLDSRMATWVAADLGYKNILNVCYCIRGNIDHTTSKKIAGDLGNDYFFLPLDGGDFLLDVDEVVEKYGGQVSYIISTGANRAMKEIAKRNIGMTVTGLLGELHNAYWTEGYEHTAPNLTMNRYSPAVDYKLPESYKEDYDNFEQMNLYEFSNLMFLSSAIVRQQSVEVASPFVDVDFLEFAYRIPLKFRKNYLLTQTWMVKKYPEAAKYVWQTMRMPVDKHFYGKIYIPKVLDDIRSIAVRGINKGARMLNVPFQISLKADMNPFEIWYRTNPQIRAFIDSYYKANIPLVNDIQLKTALAAAFAGDTRDKLQAINLLAVYKRYIDAKET